MNTIVRQRDGALIGTNTDAAGFYAPLAELDLEGAPVVLIGAGGAARAVLFALARAKVGHVTILNRSPLKAMGLLATFGLKGDVVALDVPLPPAALLVNSSSLGMMGQPPLDLDLSPLPDDAIVYDLVYAPLMTGLLRAADARGPGHRRWARHADRSGGPWHSSCFSARPRPRDATRNCARS